MRGGQKNGVLEEGVMLGQGRVQRLAWDLCQQRHPNGDDVAFDVLNRRISSQALEGNTAHFELGHGEAPRLWQGLLQLDRGHSNHIYRLCRFDEREREALSASCLACAAAA